MRVGVEAAVDEHLVTAASGGAASPPPLRSASRPPQRRAWCAVTERSSSTSDAALIGMSASAERAERSYRDAPSVSTPIVQLYSRAAPRQQAARTRCSAM